MSHTQCNKGKYRRTQKTVFNSREQCKRWSIRKLRECDCGQQVPSGPAHCIHCIKRCVACITYAACVALNFPQAPCITCVMRVAFGWKLPITSNEVSSVAAQCRNGLRRHSVKATLISDCWPPRPYHAIINKSDTFYGNTLQTLLLAIMSYQQS